MPVYKDINGTWFVECRYTDWNGEKKRHKKRGFKTQREAKEYERSYLNKTHTDKHLTFSNLSDLYLEDCKARLKTTTYHGKVSQFGKHLIPYFGRMHIEQIKPQTVRRWQTEMINQGFKDTYLSSQRFLTMRSSTAVCLQIPPVSAALWAVKTLTVCSSGR